MIAKMRKLNLAALSYDRDEILNALERTEAVEVKLHAKQEGTDPLPRGGDELSEYLTSIEAALALLLSVSESYAKEHKIELKKQENAVTYGEFLSAREKKAQIDELVSEINALADERTAGIADSAKLTRTLAQAEPYALAELPFDDYRDTQHTATRLGTLSVAAWENLKPLLTEPLIYAEGKPSGDTVLLTLCAHKSVLPEAEALLSGAGFTPCPFSGKDTGAELVRILREKLAAARARQAEISEEFYALRDSVRDLKIYCDYVGFELEKAELSEKLRATEHTFLLEAFVPAEREEAVRSALDGLGGAMWYAFSDPAEDEEVPTLCKNNRLVENFETITNMYSPPNAREFDPNTVMAFFYSVFLGFIMGDAGYGLLMFLVGGALYLKNRKKVGGIKSLAGVFAIGGIFAVAWGFAFNSLFGIAILPRAVMPDPMAGRYTFVGIEIPSMLIISMLIGIIQIFAGYLCKAWQEWRKGRFFDGLFDGVVWAVFSVGAGLAILGFVEEFHLSVLVKIGGITAGASLAFAVLTAGRHEKFFGKFTKGFGALYGIINYMSDVLSYARLYGLMLSGAVIAQIISQYGLDFITGGSIPFILLGVVLMVVGHIFNLAMSLLGAYIHDARLQYVEFYGRFFVGEGELFTPLGAKKKYVVLNRAA